MNKLSTRQATFNALRRMQPGEEFTGMSLKSRVEAATKKKCMDASPLRHLRDYRDLYGVDIECINRQRSLYRVIG